MAETRDWLRGLGLINDTDWTYWEARSLRKQSQQARRSIEELDEQHGAAIDDLRAQVKRLQVTVGVLVETLSESGAVDAKRMKSRLESALLRARVRPGEGEGPKPPPTGETVEAIVPLVCVDCGAEVKVANSFLRDGQRVCQDCY